MFISENTANGSTEMFWLLPMIYANIYEFLQKKIIANKKSIDLFVWSNWFIFTNFSINPVQPNMLNSIR